MAKKILLILGHPDSESYNHALLQAYKKGALQVGATVEEILVGKLAFNSNLAFGYRQRIELEPCLLEASLRHIKEGFLKPNVYAPKGTTLKLPDNESLCCTPRPDRG